MTQTDVVALEASEINSWMTSLRSLRSLSLDCWYECKLLPPLGKLLLLEELELSEMDKVKTVGDEFLGIPGTQTSSSSSSVLFPKLKQLTFRRMKEWEQWEGVGGSTENGGNEITIMPCLVSLTIFDCPKLMNRPLFLQKTPVKKIVINECNFLPPLGKLPFLEELEVSGMGKVKTVGDEFLGITGTPTSSSSVLFPKLKQLTFRWMSEWKQWEGVGGWTENSGDEITIMPCLVSFTIEYCPQLMNLPLFLQKTPVKKIVIRKCRRSIITPVWPENCDVKISEEWEDPVIPDVSERVETETQRDEEITTIT